MHKDERIIALDFLPNGNPFENLPPYKRKPVIQAIGTEFFSLIEVTPRDGVTAKSGEELYIGEGKRDKIRFIKGRIKMNMLTHAAQAELPHIIDQIVEQDESKFIVFFNTSGPATTRMHKLELLPKFGKKHMWEILEERKKAPFTSFANIKERIPAIPDPKKAVVQRVVEELEEKDRYRLFAL